MQAAAGSWTGQPSAWPPELTRARTADVQEQVQAAVVVLAPGSSMASIVWCNWSAGECHSLPQPKTPDPATNSLYLRSQVQNLMLTLPLPHSRGLTWAGWLAGGVLEPAGGSHSRSPVEGL